MIQYLKGELNRTRKNSETRRKRDAAKIENAEGYIDELTGHIYQGLGPPIPPRKPLKE